MLEALLGAAVAVRAALLWLGRSSGAHAGFSGGTHVRTEWALEAAFLLAANPHAYTHSPVALPVPLAAVLVRALARLGVLVPVALLLDVAAGLYLGHLVSLLSSHARLERVPAAHDACSRKAASREHSPFVGAAPTSTASEGAETRSSASSVLVRNARSRSTPFAVAALYVALPALAQGAEVLPALVRTCVLGALYHAAAGSSTLAMALLALASHVSLHPAFLLPALVALSAASSHVPFRRALIKCTVVFVSTAAALAYASAAVAGTHWSAPNGAYTATYAALIAHADVSPGPGAAWYMLVQVFPPFMRVFVFFCGAQHAVHAVLAPLRFYHERLLGPPCPLCRPPSALGETQALEPGAAHAPSETLPATGEEADAKDPSHLSDESRHPPLFAPYARPSVQGTAFAACIVTMLHLFLQPQPGAADTVTVVLLAIFAVPRTVSRGACDRHRPTALHAASSPATPLAALVALCALAGLPTVWHNWSVLGRDSANVFYFMTLAIVAAQGVLVVDAVRSRTRGRILLLNPGVEPSSLRQR